MNKRVRVIITFLVFMAFLSVGCTRVITPKVEIALSRGNEEILLKIKNEDNLDITIKSFIVEDVGKYTVKKSSDYLGWFPLVLKTNSSVEFGIGARPEKEYRATVILSAGYKDYTLVAEYPGES